MTQAVTEPTQPTKAAFGRWLALLGSAALVFAVDRIGKALVLQHLSPGEFRVPIEALRGYFSITLSYNTGAAFSLLPEAGDLFLIIAIGMIAAIVLFYRRIPPGRWAERIGLGLLMGGTCGNAVDRLAFGHVIDWVHLQLPGVISNVSNSADHAIVIGILMLFFAYQRAGKSHPQADSGSDAEESRPPSAIRRQQADSGSEHD